MLSDGSPSLPTLALIVAASENHVIGRDGELPWHLRRDLQAFKRRTMGHAMLMGRKTWDSIGRPLPGRRSLVLTRQADWRAEGATRVGSLPEAFAIAAADASFRRDTLFVIGGEEVYRAALPEADAVYLTRVHTTIAGDAFFPALDQSAWQLTSSEAFPADEHNDFATTVEVWHREGRNEH